MAWRSALSKNLQELRLSLSQTDPGSQVAAYLRSECYIRDPVLSRAAFCAWHHKSE